MCRTVERWLVACSLSHPRRISTGGSEQSELVPQHTVCLVPRAARSDGSCKGCSLAGPPQRTQKTQVGRQAAALVPTRRAALHAGGTAQCRCLGPWCHNLADVAGLAHLLAPLFWRRSTSCRILCHSHFQCCQNSKEGHCAPTLALLNVSLLTLAFLNLSLGRAEEQTSEASEPSVSVSSLDINREVRILLR